MYRRGVTDNFSIIRELARLLVDEGTNHFKIELVNVLPPLSDPFEIVSFGHAGGGIDVTKPCDRHGKRLRLQRGRREQRVASIAWCARTRPTKVRSTGAKLWRFLA